MDYYQVGSQCPSDCGNSLLNNDLMLYHTVLIPGNSSETDTRSQNIPYCTL